MHVENEKPASYKSFSIDTTAWPPSYMKLELTMNDGVRWAFCDVRRFGKVRTPMLAFALALRRDQMKVFLAPSDAELHELAPDAHNEMPSEVRRDQRKKKKKPMFCAVPAPPACRRSAIPMR